MTDVERALEIIAEGRRAHVEWAEYLRDDHADLSFETLSDAAGDPEFHERWVANYDLLERVVRGAPVHVVFDHGDADDMATLLAEVRGIILDRFDEGHPFYEEWLAPTVSDPSGVVDMVRAFVDRPATVHLEAGMVNGPYVVVPAADLELVLMMVGRPYREIDAEPRRAVHEARSRLVRIVPVPPGPDDPVPFPLGDPG
jgi:hypothetical protein